VGAGLDRVAVYFRDDAPVLGQVGAADRPEGEIHDRLRTALEGSALFWFDLLAETGLETEQALPALWDLVWAGEVTNDAWQPLRAGRRYGVPKPERRPRRFSRRRASEITATQGRWSRTERLFAAQQPDRRALAEVLLERQGIVTRDGVRGGRARARRASPGRTWCSSAARPPSSSSGEVARSCHCATPTRRGCGRRSRRSSSTCAPAAPSALRSSGSTASRSPTARPCRCSSRPASSPGPAGPSFVHNS